MSAGAPSHTVVNVGYRSTNFWVVSAGRSRFLVDLGWPGTIGMMRANLVRMGIPLGEIRGGLATHYHPDHAGLAQDLKQLGVPLFVIDVQIAAVPKLARLMKPDDGFTPIATGDNVTLTCAESRDRLRAIGLGGEILHTPGHSDDSVSLLLDNGAVFTGDLTPPALVVESSRDQVLASWALLRQRGARRVYPGHGAVYPLPAE